MTRWHSVAYARYRQRAKPSILDLSLPAVELLIAAGALYKVLAIGAERIVVEVERDDG